MKLTKKKIKKLILEELLKENSAVRYLKNILTKIIRSKSGGPFIRGLRYDDKTYQAVLKLNNTNLPLSEEEFSLVAKYVGKFKRGLKPQKLAPVRDPRAYLKQMLQKIVKSDRQRYKYFEKAINSAPEDVKKAVMKFNNTEDRLSDAEFKLIYKFLGKFKRELPAKIRAAGNLPTRINFNSPKWATPAVNDIHKAVTVKALADPQAALAYKKAMKELMKIIIRDEKAKFIFKNWPKIKEFMLLGVLDSKILRFLDNMKYFENLKKAAIAKAKFRKAALAFAEKYKTRLNMKDHSIYDVFKNGYKDKYFKKPLTPDRVTTVNREAIMIRTHFENYAKHVNTLATKKVPKAIVKKSRTTIKNTHQWAKGLIVAGVAGLIYDFIKEELRKVWDNLKLSNLNINFEAFFNSLFLKGRL